MHVWRGCTVEILKIDFAFVKSDFSICYFESNFGLTRSDNKSVF